MRIIGLTGNIASGKSTVAARLAAKGAHVIDADQLARDAVAPGTPALTAILERWGPGVGSAAKGLDRAALRQIVFRDAAARAELDAIVHPAIAALRESALDRARAAGTQIVVCDIPQLFEAGLEDTVQEIVLVDAPAAHRRARLHAHRALTGDDADAMIAAQMPSERKRARAHHVIENSGTVDELHAKVDALWETLDPRTQRG
jgi:dephospho-CoA kinase